MPTATDTTTDPYTPATPVPRVWPAAPTKVYRYDPLGTTKFTELPNVRCLSVTKTEGADPGTATLDYDWTNPSANAPHTPEEAVSVGGSPPPWTVVEGDRVVVKCQKPDATWECVFDGEALDFSTDLSADAEEVRIVCVGIARRLWDEPIPGQTMRDSDALDDPAKDRPTDVKASFNPRGEPNCIPDGHDATSTAGGDYPTFMDPLVVRDPDVRRKWTLPLAVRYLLYRHNDAEEFVTNPAGLDLDALLVSKEPNSTTAFDPTNAATYTEKDIIVPDTPLTGRDLVTAVFELVRDYGFGVRIDLTTSGTGEPETKLVIFQQQTGTLKPVFIQARGSALDRQHTNCPAASVRRELVDVANCWTVEGALTRYEASFVLAPGFPMAAADGASVASIKAFDKNDASYQGANHDAYRVFVFDETGEGHYANGTNTKLTTVPSLTTILGTNGTGDPDFANRRRKPIGELNTRDDNGTRLKWELAVSTDYAGSYPAVWDGTGTWQSVNGGDTLLKDRIGVRIGAANPNAWNVGPTDDTTKPYGRGVVKVVEALNNLHGNTYLFIRLTCVIEGDHVTQGKADRRDASPIDRDIARTVDARDRFRKEVVSANSLHNATGTDVIARDDADAAKAEATAVQLMTEAGRLDARFTIDHVTTWYDVGDRISQIYGRGTPLRTDAGGTGERPVLPVVTARTIQFHPEQKTFLTATDAGAGRSKFQRANRHGSKHV